MGSLFPDFELSLLETATVRLRSERLLNLADMAVRDNTQPRTSGMKNGERQKVTRSFVKPQTPSQRQGHGAILRRYG